VITARQNQHPACNLHVPGKNRLLTLLEESGCDGMIERLERVTLQQKATLMSPDTAITHAFFPIGGVGSLVVNVGEGGAIEVGTTGSEGMVGIPLLLGADRAHTEAFVQIEGDFLRVTADVLKLELRSNPVFGEIARRYVQAFFAQAAQSAACLRFHAIEQRLCRWILESHDRVGAERVPLTQEFLAMMLGVQRPGVTLAAAQLQKAGFIKYHRGVIDVLDRKGVEASSCECYAVVRKEYERLLC
jgi:CRP-like cAMP-binding protein